MSCRRIVNKNSKLLGLVLSLVVSIVLSDDWAYREQTGRRTFTTRYKLDDDSDHETDQWGYTETDPLPALRITSPRRRRT